MLLETTLTLLPVAGAALLFTTALVSVVYALGSLLADPKITAWAKEELSQVFYSGVLISLIFFILALSSNIINEYVYALHPKADLIIHTYPDYSDNYLMAIAVDYFNVLFREAFTLLYTLLRSYNLYGVFSDLTLKLGIIATDIGDVSFSPFAFYGYYTSLLSMVLGYFINIIFLVKFQSILLDFTYKTLSPVLLGAGVVLRTFPMTRKLGGLLMGISLSLYFVLPGFYVLGSLLYYSMLEEAQRTISPTATVFSNFDLNYGRYSYLDPGESPSITYDSDISTINTNKDIFYTGIENINNECETLSLIDIYDTLSESTIDVFTHTSSSTSAASQTSSHQPIVLRLISDTMAYPVALSQFMSADFIFDENGLIDLLARFVFFGFFFSFLSIMSFIAGVKSLSGILGGDVEIAGLTHFI